MDGDTAVRVAGDVRDACSAADVEEVAVGQLGDLRRACEFPLEEVS